MKSTGTDEKVGVKMDEELMRSWREEENFRKTSRELQENFRRTSGEREREEKTEDRLKDEFWWDCVKIYSTLKKELKKPESDTSVFQQTPACSSLTTAS